MNSTKTPAVFIDRDGTINEDIGYVSRADDLIIYPWAAEAVRLINNSGRKVVVVTNQSGIARALYDEATLAEIHNRLIEELASRGARVDAIYYCPHHPEIGDERYHKACECRKPQPGMLNQAAREHKIDLARSYVIGDKASDINLASSVGARSTLVMTGYGRETLANSDLWRCKPDLIADDLLQAVKLILDQ